MLRECLSGNPIELAVATRKPNPSADGSQLTISWDEGARTQPGRGVRPNDTEAFLHLKREVWGRLRVDDRRQGRHRQTVRVLHGFSSGLSGFHGQLRGAKKCRWNQHIYSTNVELLSNTARRHDRPDSRDYEDGRGPQSPSLEPPQSTIEFLIRRP